MRQLAKQCAPQVTDYAAQVVGSSAFSNAWQQAFKTFLETLSFRFRMWNAILPTWSWPYG